MHTTVTHLRASIWRTAQRALLGFCAAVGPFAVGTHAQAEIAYQIEADEARLVLRWDRPVDYTLKRIGRFYLFRFNRSVRGTIESFADSIGQFADQARLLGKNRVLLIRVKSDDVEIRHRRDGKAVVVTIRDRVADERRRADRVNPSAAPPPVQLLVTNLGGAQGYALSFHWATAFRYRIAAEPRRVTLVFLRRGRVVLAANTRQQLDRLGATMTQRALGDTIIVTLAFKADVIARANRHGRVLKVAIMPKPANPPALPRRPGAISPSLTVDSANGGTRLVFDWPVSVSAAAFRYGGHLWLVFGAPARFNLAKAKQRLGKDVEDIEQTLLDNATIVRLRTAHRVSAALRREGWVWRVTLRKGRLLPRTPIFVRAFPKGAGGGKVRMRAGAAGSVISITDPAVGSTLFILPLRAPGLGIERAKRYPTFRLLPSVQGIVIEPLADGLTVTVRGDTVEITNPHGLFVSGTR